MLIHKDKNTLFRYILLLYSLFWMLSGCNSNNNEISRITKDKSKYGQVAESEIVGFYTGIGLYNASNATLDLGYGGRFVMEDLYLPEDGIARGKWVLNGSAVEFYMNGVKSFSASIARSNDKIVGIRLKGSLWKKVR